MFKIKDKDSKDQIHELELIYDSDGDIDLRIDGRGLMCFFQDGSVTLEKAMLQHFNLNLLEWRLV